MPSIIRLVGWLGPGRYVLQAIFASAIGIGLLLGFILLRRAYRLRYFKRRNARTLRANEQWEGILDGTVPAETWRLDRLDCEVVETMLLDRLEVAPPEKVEPLVKCLRRSGLADLRAYEARHGRGWRQRNALLSLGRMRAPEALPALTEALRDHSAETRMAAIRGLGRTGLSAAGRAILDHLERFLAGIPPIPIQNALYSCCQSQPGMLIPYIRHASDALRPLLARVLGGVATAKMTEELVLLAGDPLAEVRASMARTLGRVKTLGALSALTGLVADKEWFVRLRAVVALGESRDPHSIPVLVAALCDENRFVRLRAAEVLTHFEADLVRILDTVRDTEDRYALEALVSELERSGTILRLIDALLKPERGADAAAVLERFLKAGTHRMLLDAMTHHAQPRVRKAVARLLARSGETRLVPHLERLLANAKPGRERRVLEWVLRELLPGAKNTKTEERVAV